MPDGARRRPDPRGYPDGRNISLHRPHALNIKVPYPGPTCCSVADLFHQERNYQGKDSLSLFPVPAPQESGPQGAIRSQERLGGLLKFYGPPHEYFFQTGVRRLIAYETYRTTAIAE